jgi:Mce-associated membrane protein
MTADDDRFTDPTRPVDPVDPVDGEGAGEEGRDDEGRDDEGRDDEGRDDEGRDDPARPAPAMPGLAAATLSALRAGVRNEPPPAGEAVDLQKPTVTEADDSGRDEADGSDAGGDEVGRDDAEADDAEADDAEADDGDHGAGVRARSSTVTAVCAAVAVAALVFAAVAGVLWWRADHGTARKIGVAREQIDADARLAIVTVNTADYRHPSDALTNWLDVSAGALHSQFSQSRTTVVKVLAEAKMTTKAAVLDAAVTAVNLRKGTATVIASVNVTRTPAKGAVSTVRNRFRASMTRTGGGWKLANLAVVPVSLS